MVFVVIKKDGSRETFDRNKILNGTAWRRFQIKVQLATPTRAQAVRFLEKLASRFGGDLGYAPRTLADKLAGASFAELEEFALDVRRRAILKSPDADLRRITQERIEHHREQVTQ